FLSSYFCVVSGEGEGLFCLGMLTFSGFGLGFERILMYITGMNNIRDVIAFPRTPRHLQF
ncbi:MAG: hypothetical protein OXB84_06720, partial [Halobacteriovoraceae bacterium]|nr:hypothetical protein [Halobacteriovoraceae bacterium]